APGFSGKEAAPWFFEEVSNSGYLYDSSIFPARRGHGGDRRGVLAPHTLHHGRVSEFPISEAQIGPMRVCSFGGGYLRLFPYGVVRRMAKRQMDEGRSLIFYVHPRGHDPQQQPLPM